MPSSAAIPRAAVIPARRKAILAAACLLLCVALPYGGEEQSVAGRKNKRSPRASVKYGQHKKPASFDAVDNAPPPPPVGEKRFNAPDVAILVLTRRDGDGMAKRAAIRATWSEGYDNVWFMIGQACKLPPKYRVEYTCDLLPGANGVDPTDQAQWDAVLADEDAALATEAESHSDVVTLPMTDVYRQLPRKVKELYRWGLENTNARWFLKVDDDQYVRVGLTTELFRDGWGGGKGKTLVAAGFKRNANVHREGKWGDKKYQHAKWPPYPDGGAHAVTRDLAQYFVDNIETLVEYQGEDASLGVWIDEAAFTVQMAKSVRFVAQDGNRCFDPSKYVVGHNINALKMHKCFEKTRAFTVPGGVG